MPDFYLETQMRQDRESFQRQADAIDAQIAELTAQKDILLENIEEIDKVLGYVSADFPTITKLATTGTFTAEAISGEDIKLTWDSVTDATGYNILISLYADFREYETETTNLLTKTISTFNGNPLVVNQTYYFELIATASGKADSDPATANQMVLAQLDTPGGLTLSSTITAQVDVQWLPVASAEGYKVYRGDTNVFADAVEVEDTPLEVFSDTTVTTGNDYYYWVLAYAANYVNSATATDNITAS